MEEATAAATPDSSHPQQIRPAAPVRVVARICPGGTGSFQVAARAVDSSTVVSLLPRHEDNTSRPGAPAPRKDHDYRLDCCYPKDDDLCHQIFQREVKPLVDAIFRGTNSCVVACGASAKTHLIMGQCSGLLTMAMEQILILSQTTGATVSVSSYQVLQDAHVFDILKPKDNDVLVLEDANGRTNLKGLSRFHVKSIHEFADLCCCGTSMLKHPAKTMQPTAGHRGFIIYISSFDQERKECVVSRMDFLDLAGYVDPKQRTNGGGLAPPNCNKSMYALMNVVQALNSNQGFIPYRQSKLTRVLQDSLCKTNNAVLIACLDEFSSQDAISTLSLASRSSQVVNEQYYHLSLDASAKNLSRSLLPSIRQPSSALDKHSRPQLNNSAVKASRTPAAEKRSKVAMHSAKKHVSSVSTCTKQRSVKSTLSGRKLFFPGNNVSKELQSSLDMEIQDSLPADEGCDEAEKVLKLVPCSMQELVMSSMQEEGCDEAKKVIELVPCSMQELVLSSIQEEESLSGLHADHSCTNLEEMHSSDLLDDVEKTPVGAPQSSPKLTDKLREISNSLKLLNSMPMSVMKQKSDLVGAQDTHTNLPEPKTPAFQLKFGHVEDSHELLTARSTGVKKTLAKECLMFLNSANKEQLKSLKGIGEKRANYILERREESPELFKEIDDLRNIIGMNNKEIKTLMSGMVMDL